MKIPHASWPKTLKHEIEDCNKFNKDLKTAHIKKKKNLKKTPQTCENRDFSGSPMVKNPASTAKGVGSIPDQEPRPACPLVKPK